MCGLLFRLGRFVYKVPTLLLDIGTTPKPMQKLMQVDGSTLVIRCEKAERGMWRVLDRETRGVEGALC
jgi:hypothetical protein